MTVYVVSRSFDLAIGVFSTNARACKFVESLEDADPVWIESFVVDLEYIVDYEEEEEEEA